MTLSNDIENSIKQILPSYQSDRSMIDQANSIVILAIIHAIEKQFKIEISIFELEPSAFENLDAVVSLVRKKLK